MTPPPTKIVAAHANYLSRIDQLGRPRPSVPDYFLKPLSALARDRDSIVLPAGCRYLSAEGEMALVVGRRARAVTHEGALRHVAGVAAANDVGLHDFIGADRGSLVRDKGQDGFCPVGPIAPADEVDLSALTLRTTVNGELLQEAGTGEMLFDPAYLIADLSRFMTLEPGDLVLTGTPAGARPLRVGDEVTVELVGVSRVTNRVVAGDPPAQIGAQPADTDTARLMSGLTTP